MSTIVVVRRGATACIACDTLANLGSIKQKAHYSSAPGKIFAFGESLIGTVGYAVHNAVLHSYFTQHRDEVDLTTPATIFETWRRMHRTLRDDYHMNPRADSDDAYQTTRMSALIANPHGIFGVTPARDVESYPRFWAIGSGASYALGAMFTLYERGCDAAEVARAGVAAGAEFDDGSELPIVLHEVALAAT